MTAGGDRNQTNINSDYLALIYKRHVQGGIVRSVASIIVWCCSWIAYYFGNIKVENFVGVSFPVLFLILFNLPTLWILKQITSRKLFGYFSLFINLLEIIGYTAIMHFLGGIQALYLLPIYSALIIYVGVMGPRNLPFIIASFCVICFNLMLIFEYFGILRTYQVLPTVQFPWPNQIEIMLVNISLLFVVAFISSYTSRLLKRNRDQLRRQNEELRLALRKASESDRLKSEFLANMSHELRTPLNAIIGFSELLEYQYPEKLDRSQKEYVSDINASGKHLLSIINDVLDISKVESGKMLMELTDVHLPTLLDDSLVMFKEKAAKHGVQLTTAISECPEAIRADELRLRQIIYNLLSNAIKFTPDGGAVILSARHLTRINDQWIADNGQLAFLPVPVGHERIYFERIVDITVTDTGIGVKEEDLERIFKPFEQGDGSISRRYQGTGLGLSLAKRFVELHGGYICVESMGENKGSSFHCVIPA
jgi:signal transduction histidine kinase